MIADSGVSDVADGRLGEMFVGELPNGVQGCCSESDGMFPTHVGSARDACEQLGGLAAKG